jgi:ketosteroid isomerase-like protein
MKKCICQLLIMGLFVCAKAYAQDAASTPFRGTPPPSEPAAPAQTPAPPTPAPPPAAKAEQASPAEENVPVASAQPVVRPALPAVRAVSPRPANAKPAPRPEQREEAKPAARDAGIEEAVGDVGGVIKRLEAEWETAIAKHDPSIIERVVADDFVGVSSTGRIGDKGTLLYEARRDKNSYKTASARQMTVRTYGSRVAVVLGMTKESGTTASGRPFDHTYRFTDTWMERDGKWQCIAAHAAVAGKR